MNLITATVNLNWFDDAGNAAYPERAWEVRYPLIAEMVIASGAHIVSTQESRNVYPGVSQTRMVAEKIGWKHIDGGGNTGIIWNPKRIRQMSAAQSFPINETIRRTDKWPNRGERCAVYALFADRLTSRRFLYGSAHGPVEDDVPTGHTIAEMRTEAGTIIGDRLNEMRAYYGDVPAIIGGDWNSVGGLQAAIESRGFNYTYTDPSLTFEITPPNIDTANGYDPTMSARQNGWVIDGLIVSPEVVAVKAGARARRNSGGGLPLATPLATDHLLVFAEVSLL